MCFYLSPILRRRLLAARFLLPADVQAQDTQPGRAGAARRSGVPMSRLGRVGGVVILVGVKVATTVPGQGLRVQP
ncbi:MAG TPA: hypothetical protein VH137_06740, partial [Gemmatimonadales bacterium]|nr:hypothetical protein [Gemmatimonadales bacterium]